MGKKNEEPKALVIEHMSGEEMLTILHSIDASLKAIVAALPGRQKQIVPGLTRPK